MGGSRSTTPVSNGTGSAAAGDLYYEVRRGAGVVAQAVVQSGTLPASQTVAGTATLNVPATAPVGTYEITFSIGSAFGSAVDSESFTLAVTAALRGSGLAWDVSAAPAWALTGSAARSAAAVEATGAYPNPFSGRTAIRFALEEAGDVRLAVYDVTGREVAALADGPAEAGQHAATFEADGLAAGVYVWRLVADGHVETGRITLVR